MSGVKSARPDRTTDIATLEGDGETDSLGQAVEDAGDIVVD